MDIYEYRVFVYLLYVMYNFRALTENLRTESLQFPSNV